MSNKPCVIHDTAQGVFRSTLEDEAFARREIELEGAIDRSKSMDTIRALRFLAEEDSEKSITLLINSEGGSVVDGLAIYDTMRVLPCPVRTICVGEASSMAAVILAGGEKGSRAILPNAQVMIHDPILTGCGGPDSGCHQPAPDAHAEARRRNPSGLYGKNCGGDSRKDSQGFLFHRR